MVQTTIFIREVQSINGMLEQLSATQDAIAKQAYEPVPSGSSPE